MFRKALFVTVALFASATASAQQYDWKLTPYLWAAAAFHFQSAAHSGPKTHENHMPEKYLTGQTITGSGARSGQTQKPAAAASLPSHYPPPAQKTKQTMHRSCTPGALELERHLELKWMATV